MSHFDEVLESPEWAFAFAAALEQQLGDDRILSVGSARAGVAEILGEEPTRSVSLGFTTANGYRGSITLTAVATFAQTLQDAASDATISTTCGAAFEAAVRMIAEQAVVGVDAAPEYSIDAEADTNAGDDGDGDGEDGVDVAAFPLLDGRDVLASLALTMSSNAQAAPTETTPPTTPEGATARVPVGVGGASGPSYVLADVEMGVTAELGRCRMTMRDLLSITPGAVIDLDRAAGAPVDVLVNGTLIARGEVVVVDEEFGIRISELVAQPAGAR